MTRRKKRTAIYVVSFVIVSLVSLVWHGIATERRQHPQQPATADVDAAEAPPAAT